jgi:cytochrome P450
VTGPWLPDRIEDVGTVTTVDLMAQADAEAALLELAPEGVVRDVTGPYWVLRHADVERLAHHPDVLGVGLSFFDLMGIGDGPLRRWYGSLMFTTEGPQHHRLRRLVSKASRCEQSRRCGRRPGRWSMRRSRRSRRTAAATSPRSCATCP